MTTDTTTEQLIVRRTIPASRDAVFAVLADPRTHGAIDGTGWVGGQRDGGPVTEAGQVFEMDMFHENAGGAYVMRNEVIAFEPQTTIAWLPIGQGPDGSWAPGGWVWRYDLADADGGTELTLTYDWSGVPEQLSKQITFPPFPTSHVERSLANIEKLATT